MCRTRMCRRLHYKNVSYKNVSHYRCVIAYMSIVHSPFCFASVAEYNRAYWTYLTYTFLYVFFFQIISRPFVIREHAERSLDDREWTASKQSDRNQMVSRQVDLKIYRLELQEQVLLFEINWKNSNYSNFKKNPRAEKWIRTTC